MVNDRQSLDLTTFAHAPANVEWRISAAPVPYPEAVAAMEVRAAEIADGTAAELVWLLEHPPLYTSGTSGKEADLLDPRFPLFTTGRDRRHPRFHDCHGLGVGDLRVGYPPFDSRACWRLRKGRQIEALAVINHWLTITWSGETSSI